ncbi:MAG: purine-binding chemotaxis protein CheW [Lachnospiraceae bacterium]|nr:purine-binding chemotaxis protein CheW [Lachnospiraceae bacterium]
MAEEKHVIFKLENESYSMNIDYIRAIEQQYTIIPLPNAPENIKGMINLRGDIIPVYSLRARFSMDEVERTKEMQVLIAKSGNIQLAFEVDAVVGIETVDDSHHREVPLIVRGEATNYMGGILNINDGIVVEISMKNIMTESEWEDLDELIHHTME